MALITTKNVISPFTNKLHLICIVLIVVAFTALRLAGGEIDLVKKGLTPTGNQIEASKPSLLEEKETDPTDNQENEDEEETKSLSELEEMFQ